MPVQISTIPFTDYSELKTKVLDRFEEYRTCIVKNSYSNLMVREIRVGDRVFIQRDFDANPSTIKRLFESVSEAVKYEVCKFPENILIRIMNADTNK